MVTITSPVLLISLIHDKNSTDSDFMINT